MKNTNMKFWLACAGLFLAMAGCATFKNGKATTLRVPHLDGTVTVDGKLDEACYRENAPLASFVVAGDKKRTATPTKAWLFWNDDSLTCAFECADYTSAWAAPNGNERNVDGQDRAELFLWTGDAAGPYCCMEMAPDGAIHDYEARFYRQFDDQWSPAGGWSVKTRMTAGGYTVEMTLPKEAVETMGLKLQAGNRFRVGLFRADYDKYNGEPTWITWIDHGGKPDFHLAGSFGTAVLAAPAQPKP